MNKLVKSMLAKLTVLSMFVTIMLASALPVPVQASILSTVSNGESNIGIIYQTKSNYAVSKDAVTTIPVVTPPITIPDPIVTPSQTAYDIIKTGIIAGASARHETITITIPSNITISRVLVQSVVDDFPKFDPYDYFSISEYSFGSSMSRVTMSIKYATTAVEEAEVSEKVNSVLASITTVSMSQLQKEAAIHDYIVNNVQYDQTMVHHDAYSALFLHTTVCQGYALLAYKMLNQAGIETKYVVGEVNTNSTEPNHAWNMVQINGSWYWLDCTWDDPISSRPLLRYDYFNVTDAQLSKDHRWIAADYPVSSLTPLPDPDVVVTPKSTPVPPNYIGTTRPPRRTSPAASN